MVVKKNKLFKIITVGLCTLCTFNITAQNNGLLQQIDVEDVHRINQLTDSNTAFKNYSFTIRPISQPKTDLNNNKWVKLSHVNITTHYNDSLAMGYNNGTLLQATGWQSRYSLGVQAQLGRVSIKFQPEFVVAQNKEQYVIPSSFNDGDFFSKYYFMNINVIDLASRYGTESLQKFYPGQSSIKYNFNKYAVGISTENLWWGPGMHNSLVLTNNAPGFVHFTAHTKEPIQTKIGTVEGQFIYGLLEASGIEPVENLRKQNIWPGLYVPKVSSTQRTIAAYIFTLQPKWVKNLYIGFAHAYYFYNKNVTNDPNFNYPWTNSSQAEKVAKLGSIFVRYAMPEEKAEAYFEIGRSNKPATPFNLLGDTIPVGYNAGFRKLFTIGKKADFIEFAAEITRLQLPDPRLIFGRDNPYSIPKTNSWYTNARIRQGYTQLGQSLGAGIGPGSNSQRMNISWVSGANKIGIHGERVVHNNDFNYYQYLSYNFGAGWGNRSWVDLTYGAHAQISKGKWLFAGLIDMTSALNYQWVKLDGTYDGPSSLSDKKNLRISLSATYQLNQIIKLK